MSTHPNVILLCTLTPDDLARKTWRAILADAGLEEAGENTGDIKIDGEDYHHTVLEGDYDDGWQIGSKAGDILIFDLVTYGYGEQITWDKLAAQKTSLDAWAEGVCRKHNCTYKISVTANYW